MNTPEDPLQNYLASARSAPLRPDPAAISSGFESRLMQRIEARSPAASPAVGWSLAAAGALAAAAFCTVCFTLVSQAQEQYLASWLFDSWLPFL